MSSKKASKAASKKANAAAKADDDVDMTPPSSPAAGASDIKYVKLPVHIPKSTAAALGLEAPALRTTSFTITIPDPSAHPCASARPMLQFLQEQIEPGMGRGNFAPDTRAFIRDFGQYLQAYRAHRESSEAELKRRQASIPELTREDEGYWVPEKEPISFDPVTGKYKLSQFGIFLLAATDSAKAREHGFVERYQLPKFVSQANSKDSKTSRAPRPKKGQPRATNYTRQVYISDERRAENKRMLDLETKAKNEHEPRLQQLKDDLKAMSKLVKEAEDDMKKRDKIIAIHRKIHTFGLVKPTANGAANGGSSSSSAADASAGDGKDAAAAASASGADDDDDDEEEGDEGEEEDEEDDEDESDDDAAPAPAPPAGRRANSSNRSRSRSPAVAKQPALHAAVQHTLPMEESDDDDDDGVPLAERGLGGH